MEFTNATMNYFEEAIEIAYETYQKECSFVNNMGGCTKEEIAEELKDMFENGTGMLCVEGGKLLGYLSYRDMWEDNGIWYYMFPVSGYGAAGKNRTKIISMLFEMLASQLCTDGKVHFQIKLYAHDKDVIQLFSFLQFGIQCEEGICSVNQEIPSGNGIEIKEFTKEEINENWSDIWGMLQQLIGHLRKSPVFYPGTEFTENVYNEYLLDPATRLFLAIDKAQIVGMITANREGSSFITSHEDYCNVGDIFVQPDYRGKQVAQELLQYAADTLKQEGIIRLWVEHGTANPNARGFWNKYFDSYTYTMIRDIEKF